MEFTLQTKVTCFFKSVLITLVTSRPDFCCSSLSCFWCSRVMVPARSGRASSHGLGSTLKSFTALAPLKFHADKSLDNHVNKSGQVAHWRSIMKACNTNARSLPSTLVDQSVISLLQYWDYTCVYII